MRNLKIIAALFIGLLGLLAFFNNLFNIAAAQSSVAAVISAPEQPYYDVIGPTFGAASASAQGRGTDFAERKPLAATRGRPYGATQPDDN